MAGLKEQAFGDKKIKLDELKQWFDDNSAIPDDDDTMFIAKSIIKIKNAKPNPQKLEEDGSNFNCFLTNKRLIKNAIQKNTIHADSTYKLNWKGYPLGVFGCTDMAKSFHLIGFGISKTETADDYKFFFDAIKNIAFRVYNENLHFKTLVSDAAQAFKNGFKSVFPDGEDVTCFFHVAKNIRDQPCAVQANKDALFTDIRRLQLCPDSDTFNKGKRLFTDKWSAREPALTKYVNHSWFNKNDKWFEGVGHFIPTTNNAVESFNGKIKENFHFRDRPPLNEFKVRIENLLRVVSHEYRDEKKSFKVEAPISKQDWLKAYDWAKTDKNALVKKEKANKLTHYYIPDKSRDKITEKELKAYKKGNNFDDLMQNTFFIWKVSIPGTQGIKCTCPSFFKNYSCKHALGMSLRLKIVSVPENIQAVENGTARGRGRPKRARLALEME